MLTIAQDLSIVYAMFKYQFNSIKPIARLIPLPLRKPAPSTLARGVLVFPPNISKTVPIRLSPSPSKVLSCYFSSTAPGRARARFRSNPQNQPPPPPSPPPPEPEPAEYYVPPDLPPRGPKEPGSGLVKIFLAITVPVLLLSMSDDIVRFAVPREEVCEAFGLDPTKRPHQKYFDEYIRRYKPDMVFWLDLATKMRQNFSFCARNANGEGESFRWWTPLTSEFGHVGFLHLFMCFTALKVFAPTLAQLYGNRVTATIFVAGGIMAQGFVALYEKTVNPFASMSEEKILSKAKSGLTKDDESRLRRAVVFAKGSSTSLMAMGTVCAIVYPSLEVSLMFIPVGIPIRMAMGCFALFDLGGMYYDYGIPIGHSGHIGGVVAGTILYALWIRKLPNVFQRRLAQALHERGMKIGQF